LFGVLIRSKHPKNQAWSYAGVGVKLGAKRVGAKRALCIRVFREIRAEFYSVTTGILVFTKIRAEPYSVTTGILSSSPFDLIIKLQILNISFKENFSLTRRKISLASYR
jgi:hypothetical protein